MQSDKNMTLFQTTLEASIGSVTLLTKEKRSVISDILMTTLDNAVGALQAATPLCPAESKENIQDNCQFIEAEEQPCSEEIQNKDPSSSDEGKQFSSTRSSPIQPLSIFIPSLL